VSLLLELLLCLACPLNLLNSALPRLSFFAAFSPVPGDKEATAVASPALTTLLTRPSPP